MSLIIGFYDFTIHFHATFKDIIETMMLSDTEIQINIKAWFFPSLSEIKKAVQYIQELNSPVFI